VNSVWVSAASSCGKPDVHLREGRHTGASVPSFAAVRRIFPGPEQDVDVDEAYGVVRSRRADRPWVAVCMIASLDGSTIVEGRSGGLGGDGDRAVFGALRRAADVVVVGATTVRAEGYRPPQRAGQRIGVVTSTGDVDLGSELFTSGAGFLIMPEDGPTPLTRSIDVVRAGTGRADLAGALVRLEDIMSPPAFVQAEGGPRLNGALLDAGCIDELNLSIAPFLAGGAGARVIAGAGDAMRRLTLAHVLVDDDGYLFTRWVSAD
jgi:riboflavin biosynthesis pyrimidine reductase